MIAKIRSTLRWMRGGELMVLAVVFLVFAAFVEGHDRTHLAIYGMGLWVIHEVRRK